MNDETTPIVDNTPAKKSTRLGMVGLFFSLLGLVIFIIALAYGYFQLSKSTIRLAAMVTNLQQQVSQNQATLKATDQSINNLQQATQKSINLSAKQEQMISDWQAAQKGNLNRWHVAEAQYLVSLANDQIQFPHDVSSALILLTRAEQILQSISDPSVLEIRKSLAGDIANLRAVPLVNATALYLRLNALNQQINRLPLPENPLKPEPPLQRADNLNLSWWQRGLNHTWAALQKIVIVRYNGSNNIPLLLPEEKGFLYQNLHAQFEHAMWAVLHRNNDVYRTSLLRAVVWIQQYFVRTSPITISMLDQLSELQNINLQPPTANLSNTIQLFNNFFNQTDTQTTANVVAQ